MLSRMLYIAACVLVPIVWGYAVDRVFRRFQDPNRRGSGQSDYQI